MMIDKKIYDEVSDITNTSYNELVIKDRVFVNNDSVESMIEDLLCEIDRLKEKYDDLEQDLHDNYKPYTRSEMYGISESDFI